MAKHLGALVAVGALASGVAVVGYKACLASDDPSAQGPEGPVAVEVAPIESGPIREVRVFAGTLEASNRFRAAAKVGGLLETVEVDLGDRIERDQLLATIDDAEPIQAVAQAEADLAVQNADRTRAQSDVRLAEREYERAQTLKDGGLTSEQQLDEARAALDSARAALTQATGEVRRAGATLELARVRLGQTEVRASWSGEHDTATVAERYQDPGNTVQVGDPIVDVVTLDPLICVMTVPERDYGRLEIGHKGTITTDTVAGESFEATITRIAPVFRESSRQARVELTVDNSERRLQPGSFARVELVLGEADAAAIVPEAAITRREDRDVVFLMSDDDKTALLRPVITGIREAGRIQVEPEDGAQLTGEVVVLGQQLLGDRTAVHVVIPDEAATPGGAAEPER